MEQLIGLNNLIGAIIGLINLIGVINVGPSGSPPYLNGFGKSTIKSLGKFTANVNVDEEIFKVNLFVVPDEVMLSNTLILGCEILETAEIKINKNGVTIKSHRNEKQSEENIEIMAIDTDSNEDLDIGMVSDYNRAKIEMMVNTYKPNKCKDTKVRLKIIVKDDTPIYSRPRRLPFKEREAVENQVAEWLEDGIIEHSNSDYASPVVVVKKKDGTPRICIDYRRINKVIVKDRFPFPLIEELLNRLQKAKVFSLVLLI